MRNRINLSLLIAGFCAITFNASAQTLKEATELYNSTAQTYKQDYPTGIANFNKVLEMCTAIGEGSEEIRTNTEDLMPQVYFEYAMSLYKKKDLQGTLNNLETSEAMATKYNKAEIKNRVEKTLPKLYVVMGTTKLKEGKFDEALTNYNKALQFNPNLIDAQVNITATYQKMENEEMMVESLLKTIELAKKLNKIDIADNANERLKNIYLKKAEEARVAKNYDLAIANYEKTILYDSTNAIVYRNYSNACFLSEKWDRTITIASKAIELNKATDMEKADIYNELATAYHKLNNIEKACEYFKKAAFGESKPNADYQIKTLKCQ